MKKKRAQRTARQHRVVAEPAVCQYDLFTPTTSRLMGNGELRQLYAELNRTHFENSLPPASVEWSTRLRIAGVCQPDAREIRLSVSYHAHYPEELESTLLHEMLHLLHPRHDTAFRRAAEELGVSIHCQEYPGMHPRSRYVYICPNCRTVFHRRKRADISCGTCSGGKYNPRYKLVLQKSTAKRR